MNEKKTRYTVKLKALKKWGQHFLKSSFVLQTLSRAVEEFQNSSGIKAITEIGPGLGALTDYLHPLSSAYYAMERDRRFFEQLSSYRPSLHMLWGDALTQDWSACPESILVGNLPYNISVPIMLRWLSYSNRFPQALFMVQKEVGKRVIAKPLTKAYGRLSVMIQSVAEVRLVVSVDRECFVPPPKVDSCVLHLRRNLSVCDHLNVLESVLQHCFSQRRKILKNGLARFAAEFPKGFLEEGLNRVGADMHYRPEALTVNQYIKFSQYIKESGYVEAN